MILEGLFMKEMSVTEQRPRRGRRPRRAQVGAPTSMCFEDEEDEADEGGPVTDVGWEEVARGVG